MDCDAPQYKVKVMPNAVTQLDEIYDYVVTKLKAPMAAKRLNEELRAMIESLSVFPSRGSVVRTQMWHGKEIRFVVVGNYDIYYRVVADKMEINILAVAYSRRDLRNVSGIEQNNFCVSEMKSNNYRDMRG